jgi:hypothetical protein
LQFFPVDEIDRIHGGQLPVPASVLKLMDEMMGMPNQDIELLHSLMQTLKKHQRIN